jgi:hypothetical protein
MPGGGERTVVVGLPRLSELKRRRPGLQGGVPALLYATNFVEPRAAEVELLRKSQPVEKPLNAPSEHPSRTHKSRHRSVLALMSKCLGAVLDYRLLL